MRDDLLFEEEIDSGERCPNDHPMFLVAEGYAICYGDSPWAKWVSAWSRTRPVIADWDDYYRPWNGWWCSRQSFGQRWTREQALDFIHADIEAHRNLPFDEEAERARLVAV